MTIELKWINSFLQILDKRSDSANIGQSVDIIIGLSYVVLQGNLTGPDHVTNPSSGSLNSAEVDSRETVPDSKQGILPLAPIRGSLPKVG